MSHLSPSPLFHSPEKSPRGTSPSPMAHYYYPTVGSTQDEARRILRGEGDDGGGPPGETTGRPGRIFAVSAAEQTAGRGTTGRSWIAPRGNAFLTVAFPIDRVRVTPTLLPLRVGCIVAGRIRSVLRGRAEVELKWPNDVLIRDEKVAGILIESERDAHGGYWFLVGVGVNWRIAPDVDRTGPQRGRNATCIYRFLDRDDELGGVEKDVDASEDANGGVDDAKQLGYDIASDIADWLEIHHSEDRERWIEGADIVREWESWAEFGKEQTLRDTPGQDIVIPLSIEPDGRLRVKESNGTERILCADYLL